MLHASPKMIISISKPPPPSPTLSAPPTRIHAAFACSSITSTSWLAKPKLTIGTKHPKRRTLTCSCEVALKQEDVTSSSSNDYDEELEREAADARVGARVRVKVPLKVYHVPRVPEIDLTGKEGVMKQYVALWKGKRISANFPYKVEFYTDVEGRGSVKFFAHLRDDEFEFLD